jgi:hypothetical protein
MPITLNHSNISVQYSSDKSYIIENVKSDLYRRNEIVDTIIRNNIQAAPVTPATYRDSSGNIYAIESYTYSGTANTTDYTRVFTNNTTCDILVVGGGGGGGKRHGAGGGAGTLLYHKNVTMNGNYNIKVGKGGNPNPASSGTNTGDAGSGNFSQFVKSDGTQNYYAVGGGRGASGGTSYATTNGGQGWLYDANITLSTGNIFNSVAVAVSNKQYVNTLQSPEGCRGNIGGREITRDKGAGGGGAGSAGMDHDAETTVNDGYGGLGLAIDITGTSVVYAGGGSGSDFSGTLSQVFNPLYPTIQSRGGGGFGSDTGNPQNGLDGTGGGGGGSGVEFTSGAGGSGIVIIRYLLGTIPSTNNLTNEPTVIAPTYETVRSFIYSGSANTADYSITIGRDTICDILVVGGGGGGGIRHGSGGGAGTLMYHKNIILNGTYNIKVGKGGVGALPTTQSPYAIFSTDGNFSQFVKNDGTQNYYAVGGGRGTSSDAHYANTNGGQGYLYDANLTLSTGNIFNGVAVAVSNKQYVNTLTLPEGCRGNIGGIQITNFKGGGGGGAGGAGMNHDAETTVNDGYGGLGLAIDITGTSVVYAGGGNGGDYNGTVLQVFDPSYSTIQSRGGGGFGSDTGTAQNGLDGTGGGGGGQGNNLAGLNGGNGGSGIVIIKFKSIVSSVILEGVTHKRLNYAYAPEFSLIYDFTPYNTEAHWKAYATTIPNFTYSLDSFLTSYDPDAVWTGGAPVGWVQMTLPSTHNFLTITYGLGIQGLEDVRLLINGVVKSSATPTNRLITYSQAYNVGDVVRIEETFSNMTANFIFQFTNSQTYTLNFPVPTLADINNNSNIVLRGAYDIALSTTNSAIIPKAGQYIPKPTTFTNYAIERMYPPVRNFTAATTTVSGQTYGNGTYVVTYSSTYGENLDPFKCFNTSDGTGGAWALNRYTAGVFNSTSFIVSGYLGDWIKIQLPVAIKLTRFSFLQRNGNENSPKDFKIYGSNDNITWFELVNKTDAVYNASIYNQTTPEITNTYTYYGLVVNKLVSVGIFLNFDEWYIYGQELLPSSLSLRYNLLNPILDPIGAQWTYNSSNTNVYHMGSVGIGTTSPEYSLDVRGFIFTSVGGYTQTGSENWVVQSDRRIKENIVKASYEKCLDNVKKIELYNFNFKDNCVNTNDKNQLGFIAQEVQQVYPKAVEVGRMTLDNNQGINDLLTLNTTQIKYTLYGAVKNLIERVENIESRVEQIYNMTLSSNIKSSSSNISITFITPLTPLTPNITTNTSNITTNTSNVSRTSNITTNTSNITTNTSNITTNTSNI